ncbi:MAG: hypothetical protein ACLFTW_07575 [Chitinispirillaceae bacterium]
MNKLISFLIALLFLWACRCGNTTVTGGGSDLPDMSYSCRGIVAAPDSTSVSDIQVILRRIAMTSRGDSIEWEDSSMTGSDGSFAFTGLQQGGYVLYSRDTAAGRSGVSSRVKLLKDSSLQNRLILARETGMRGRILDRHNNPLSGVLISLAGTGRRCISDSMGFYSFSISAGSRCEMALFPGNLAGMVPMTIKNHVDDSVFVRDIALDTAAADLSQMYGYFSNTCSTYTVSPVVYDELTRPQWYGNLDFSSVTYHQIIDGELVAVEDSAEPLFLLDNFEDGDTLSFLNELTGCGSWYAYTDIDRGLSSAFDPVSVKDSFTLVYTDSANVKGQHIRVRSILDTVKKAYTSIACRIGDSACSYSNLDKMSAISFYAKGSGRIRVDFVTGKVIENYSETDQWGHMGSFVDLAESWTKIHIDTSQLKPAPDSPQDADGLNWASVRDSVKSIVFGSWDSPGSEVEMHIDEIYLHGMKSKDFK